MNKSVQEAISSLVLYSWFKVKGWRKLLQQRHFRIFVLRFLSEKKKLWLLKNVKIVMSLVPHKYIRTKTFQCPNNGWHFTFVCSIILCCWRKRSRNQLHRLSYFETGLLGDASVVSSNRKYDCIVIVKEDPLMPVFSKFLQT